MKEIATRLHENRQIQLAKEILESNGYKVSKKDTSKDVVQGIAYYGTKVANEFFELQDKDPRIEELVYELGLEDKIFPEDEEVEPDDKYYLQVLRAYKREKAKKAKRDIK